MLDVINIVNAKPNVDYLTLLLVIFTGGQFFIQDIQKNISLFNKKIEHYQNFHSSITSFYNIIPIKYNGEKKIFYINCTKSQITDTTIAELTALRYKVNSLKTESKYLFGSEIYQLEEKFDGVLYKLLKFAFNKEEKCNFLDNMDSEINFLVKNLRKHNEIFDKYLDILSSPIEKILRKFEKYYKKRKDKLKDVIS